MIKLTNILPVNNNKVNRLHLLTTAFFLALFTFPVLPLKVTNILLMSLAAFTLFSFFLKPFPVGKLILRNLVFVIPFLPYLVELCISGFNPAARFEFEKKILFFTAPLIIPLFMKVTGFKNYRLAFLIFSFSVVALTIYTFSLVFIKGIPFADTAYENGAFIFRDSFEKFSGLHPTYFSIFALTSACFLCFASDSRSTAFRVSCYVLAALLFVAVLLVAVRIAFITAAVFLLVWIIKSKLSLKGKFSMGVSVVAVMLLLSVCLPSLKNRFSEIGSSATTGSLDENTVSQRMMILHCSLQVFSDNIWTGTGSRHFQEKLNDCYNSQGWTMSTQRNFNPHNQFLSEGVNYGIFALLVFLACLFIIFRRVFRMDEGLYFSIAIILFFLSESMLERQMGVYFFGLIAILIYNLQISNGHASE